MALFTCRYAGLAVSTLRVCKNLLKRNLPEVIAGNARNRAPASWLPAHPHTQTVTQTEPWCNGFAWELLLFLLDEYLSENVQDFSTDLFPSQRRNWEGSQLFLGTLLLSFKCFKKKPMSGDVSVCWSLIWNQGELRPKSHWRCRPMPAATIGADKGDSSRAGFWLSCGAQQRHSLALSWLFCLF